MNFVILDNNTYKSSIVNTAYLSVDNWNDYSFVTMFYLTVFDLAGKEHKIGNVKIAFKGQTIETNTFAKLGKSFSLLTDEFFSLGDNVDYYKNLNKLDPDLRADILASLQDLVKKPERIEEIQDEQVLNIALLRSVALSEINGTFARVLAGLAELSDFNFNFLRQGVSGRCDLNVPFEVKVGTTPSTNLHAFIV